MDNLQIPSSCAQVTWDTPPLHNLPGQLSSFVGREQDLSEVQNLLVSSRLLTITGIGGVGKTCLALHAATTIIQAPSHPFWAGVWLIELGELSDPARVPQAILHALGLQEKEDILAVSTLCAFFHSQPTLLIFDSCEHIIEACSPLFDVLLRRCSTLHILATSREVLGIEGERIFPLSPLALPDDGDFLSLEDFVRVEAVELFLARVRAVRPHFLLTTQNAHAIAQICRSVDGLPLALELAASHASFLPAEQLSLQMTEKPDKLFLLLERGNRVSPLRQQSLRATIDWSYVLLSQSEQLLLQRLAVFAGSWDLESALSICADELLDDRAIFDSLAQLVNKSLITMQEQPASRPSDLDNPKLSRVCARYSMLTIVKRYILEKLQLSQCNRPVQYRHLAYFLALAEEAEPLLRGVTQLAWLEYLDHEQENFQAALQYSQRIGEGELGLRMASALWWYYVLRTRLSEGRSRLLAMLTNINNVSAELRATALYRASMLAFFQGDLAQTNELARESLNIFQHLHQIGGIALATAALVHGAIRLGDLAYARVLGEESLLLARKIGDPWYLAFTLLPLAMLHSRRGESAEAALLSEESLLLFRMLEDRLGMAYAFDALGQIAHAQHEYDSALTCFQQGLALFEELGYANGVARSLLHLGLTQLELGDYLRAATTLEQSLQLCRKFERRIGVARSLLGLARVKLYRHALQEAAPLLEESLRLFMEHGDMRGTASTLYRFWQLASISKDQEAFASISQSEKLWSLVRRITPTEMPTELLALAEPTELEPYGRMRPKEWFPRVVDSFRQMIALSTRTQSPPRPHRGRETVPPHLTPREIEVLTLVAQGLNNSQVALQLILSTGTVRTHLESIYSKLGVPSRAAAVHYAHEHHLL